MLPSLPVRRCAITLSLLGVLLAGAGCGRVHLRKYEAGVVANRQAVLTLRLGMTREQVVAAMGSGDVVRYGKIRLTDPWRTEAFRTPDGARVEILYYVTDGYQWKRWSEQRVLTPIVLEEDTVVGWGWPFVERNRSRYFAAPAAPVGAGKS